MALFRAIALAALPAGAAAADDWQFNLFDADGTRIEFMQPRAQ